MKKILTPLLLLVLTTGPAQSQQAYQDIKIDMTLTDGKVYGQTVHSQLPATSAPGIDGQALRFDGYSTWLELPVDATALTTESGTYLVTLAAETYPMMQVDVAETTPTYATICGNLDETNKRGFALELSSQGDLRARFAVDYGGGYILTIQGNKKLPRGEWCQVTLEFEKEANKAWLFLNGEVIGDTKVNNRTLQHSTLPLRVGKDATDVKSGPFLLNTFCGLIDDISLCNSAFHPIKFNHSEQPDFNYPASRYEGNLWRPQYHGMPSGSWTNESHGLIFSGGRWHVFFQKNANGPYMSRLHWGHLSSADLCSWREEPIAIYPGEPFDIKGCWSGCVYEDGDDTYILYTAVDNEKARIVQAKAKDNTLVEWGDKQIVIDGRPAGLSDDFRDPYYFEANGNKYIIVGSSKNHVGACTLHQLKNGSWTNDGAIFFQGSTAALHGTFWEMPNVTPLGNGKFLFTCTPLGTQQGVRTLCWVGTIGIDGKFTPDASGMQYLEMAGISRDGYGLLSPTIYQKDGKTLLLGIVPDKLADTENYKMGWAHNYSLPRELSVDANGQLVQKPYSGLTSMRSDETVSIDETLLGTKALVSGRQIELLGEFTPTSGTCGFRFLDNASLTYDVASKSLTLDVSNLQRVANDNGSYNGIYTTTVPETLRTLHVFLDGSILDIFVNDRWAYSVRVFPTDAAATATEVFSTGSTAVKVQSWTLDAGKTTSIHENVIGKNRQTTIGPIYDFQGRCLNGRPSYGLYIQNGKKYVAR